jgi:hypothetical protein
MSIVMDDFPNYFMQTGPNFSVGNGNMIIVFEKINEYFVKCIQKIQREGIRSMEIKREAVQDFYEFTEAYFPKTVYSQDVSLSLDVADCSAPPGLKLEKMDG